MITHSLASFKVTLEGLLLPKDSLDEVIISKWKSWQRGCKLKEQIIASDKSHGLLIESESRQNFL
jgi:hypothetical protein